MSRENVEIVRDLFAAFNGHDVDALVGIFYSPEAEWIPALETALEGGTVYRGSAEIRSYYDELLRFDWPTARSCGTATFSTMPRPSQPWDCRSRPSRVGLMGGAGSLRNASESPLWCHGAGRSRGAAPLD